MGHRRKLAVTLWLVLLLLTAELLTLRLAMRWSGLAQSLHGPAQRLTPAEQTRARALLTGLEDVQFRTADGLLLRGWYQASRNGAAVIFLHGGGSNRTWFLPDAVALARQGFGVLLYDARACGESEGRLQTWGEQEQLDLRAALDYLAARPDVDAARIGVDGFSVGSTTASLAAAADPRVHALVLNAIWPSLGEELRYKLGRFQGPGLAKGLERQIATAGVSVDAVRPIARIGLYAPRPLLIVAGDQDRDTPLAQVQRVFDAAGGDKQLYVVPGAAHGNYLATAGPAYLARIVDFFQRTLGRAVG